MENVSSKVIGALIILGVIVVMGTLVFWVKSGVEEAQKPETTFSDMVKKDKEEMLGEPKAEDLTKNVTQTEPEAAKEKPQPKEPVANEPAKKPTPKPPSPNQPSRPVKEANEVKPKMPTTLYFTTLDETEDIAAEQMLAMLPAGRSIGRLPMTGFSMMVETCRQIMQRWPDSIYDYKARRALNEMPERFRERYHITEQDLDLMQFTKQRPNTTPYTIKEED